MEQSKRKATSDFQTTRKKPYRGEGEEPDHGNTSASSIQLLQDQSYAAPAAGPTLQNYQANIIGDGSGNFTANSYTYNYLSGGGYSLPEY
jgi:hypothetical protein